MAKSIAQELRVSMKKEFILQEIRRTAKENGGTPLGRARFETETGIKLKDWYGVHWARWGDALLEAGFTPDQLQGTIEKADLLFKYVMLARELGRLPTEGELRLRAKRDPNFPSHTTFTARLGSKQARAITVKEFCEAQPEFSDVARMCESYAASQRQQKQGEENEEADADEAEFGCVYLMKSGRYYKIGRSNAAGRREYELAIQLPDKLTTIHVIRTDDPGGIEAYWHKRFESKRLNGEWFDLDSKEVAAFKRRKFM